MYIIGFLIMMVFACSYYFENITLQDKYNRRIRDVIERRTVTIAHKEKDAVKVNGNLIDWLARFSFATKDIKKELPEMLVFLGKGELFKAIYYGGAAFLFFTALLLSLYFAVATGSPLKASGISLFLFSFYIAWLYYPKYMTDRKRNLMKANIDDLCAMIISCLKSNETVDGTFKRCEIEMRQINPHLANELKKLTYAYSVSPTIALNNFSAIFKDAVLKQIFIIIKQGLKTGGSISDELTRITADLKKMRMIEKQKGAMQVKSSVSMILGCTVIPFCFISMYTFIAPQMDTVKAFTSGNSIISKPSKPSNEVKNVEKTENKK